MNLLGGNPFCPIVPRSQIACDYFTLFLFLCGGTGIILYAI